MKQNKTKLAIAIMIIVSLLLVAGCTGYTVKQKNQKVKIGIMTPLTGPAAFLGENIVKSAELAVQEMGLQDQVELLIEDSGKLGGGGNTLSAYNKLVHVDNVKFIIDGMLSDGTMAVAPLLENNQVVMMTPLTGGENIDLASPYLFRNGPSDIIAGTKPAQDIYHKFGYKRVALFTDNAEYTLDIAKHFRKTFKGNIVLDEIVEADLTDYKTVINKLQGKQVDAVVINTQDGVSAAYIIKQLYELGYGLPVFGNFLALTENGLTIAGKAFEGVYIYDPEFDENAALTKAFFVAYEKKFNKKTPIPFHTTGVHDNIKMFMQAQQAVGYDGAKMRSYLLSYIQNWQGMNGLVSFDHRGNTQTGFVLKQVKNGALVGVA